MPYLISENEFDIDYKKRDYSWSMNGFHYHYSYEIYYLLEGSRTVLADNRIFEMHPGDIVLFKPKLFHKSTGNGAHTRINIEFTDKFIDKYFTSDTKNELLSCFNNTYMHFSQSESDKFYNLYVRLCEEYKNGGMFYITLAELLKFITEKRNSESIPKIHKHLSKASKKLEPVISYINMNYSEISSIDEIAEACYINKSYLCRLFKRELGMTVMEYLSNVKIQQSCELIATTNNTITDIALKCGFTSSAYFCCVFKDIMHCTPSEFRKRRTA